MKLNWRLTAFSLICLTGFANLGLWQLDRADEKRAMLADNATQRSQAPLTAAELLALPVGGNLDRNLDGLPVRMQGQYSDTLPLLRDNVVVAGTVGFEVLSVFTEASTEQRFLINRGFVPMGRTRSDAPAIPAVPAEQVTLTGEVYVSRGSYGNSSTDTTGALGIVQTADPIVLSPLLPAQVYPHLVRLSLEDPMALPRNWVVSTVSVAKHQGYAVQWFLMALAVVVAYSYFTFKLNRQ